MLVLDAGPIVGRRSAVVTGMFVVQSLARQQQNVLRVYASAHGALKRRGKAIRLGQKNG
jgi:hypothetical protein